MPTVLTSRASGYAFPCLLQGNRPVGAKHRGLLSVMRRHRQNLSRPQHGRLSANLRQHSVLETIYTCKQRLCSLLLEKAQNQKRCRRLAKRLLTGLAALRFCGLLLVALPNRSISGEMKSQRRHRREPATRHHRRSHSKMKVLQRQAYGFRNFQNHRS